MKKWLADIAKWTILVLLIFAGFYLLRPKYEFIPVTIGIGGPLGGGRKTIYICRCNKFTGHVDFLNDYLAANPYKIFSGHLHSWLKNEGVCLKNR